VDLVRDPHFFALVEKAVSQSSAFFMQVIQCSPALQRSLESSDIQVVPTIDTKLLEDNLDLRETLPLLKKVVANMAAKTDIDPPYIAKIVEYFKKLLGIATRESDSVGKFLETQMMRTTRYDVKESSFMKAQIKAKEMAAAITESTIHEMCRAMFYLFKTLTTFWRSKSSIPEDLLDQIVQIVTSPVPTCRSDPHPIILVHHSLQQMLVYAMTVYPQGSPVRSAVEYRLPSVWIAVLKRDIAYTVSCAGKDMFESQLMMRYPTDRELRQAFFKIFVSKGLRGLSDVLDFVLTEMIHNSAQLKTDSYQQARYLEFPVRSEAMELVTFVLESRQKLEQATTMLISKMVKMKFVEKERHLICANDHLHLVESSIELLRTILTCETEFPAEFILESKKQLDSLKLRFVAEWNPEILAVLNPTNVRSPVFKATAKTNPSQGGNAARMRASTPMFAGKNGPKIVTLKSAAPRRGVTSLGRRKI
jgi:DNA-binding MarR family transcriptional regulator